MNGKQFVGWGLIASVIIGIVGTVFSYDVELSDSLYTLAGIGLYLFGIAAAYLLLKRDTFRN